MPIFHNDISKYFPPAKIISLRNDIMNLKKLDREHVAQSWERMKLMIRNCPTHGLNLWMIIQKNYAGLNFSSRNLLDSVAEALLWKLLYILFNFFYLYHISLLKVTLKGLTTPLSRWVQVV